MTIDLAKSSNDTIEAFVKHWSIMRLESHDRLIARYDDAAKQLISVAGVLEGIYIAAYAFGDSLSSASPWLGAAIMTPLLFVIFFAARGVCVVPLTSEAMAAFELLRHSCDGNWNIDNLEAEMDRWCQQVDALALKKRRYLHLANWSFVIAMFTAVVWLFALMM